MRGLIQRAAAAAVCAALVAAAPLAPRPAAAQDLSSQITRDLGAVVATASAEWNKFVQLANDSLPAGSSVPGLTAPQPPAPLPLPLSGAWQPQAPAPVANGANGEVFAAGRSYLVWVPANYNPARPTPVLVGYSALDDSAENFRNYSKLRESAAGREAIILYPRSIGASWEGAPTAKTRPGEDIRFVRAMIEDAARYYNIDRRRIYATGMSTGGGMAAVSACHMPDIFAGVAAVSGAFYAPVNMGCRNTPVAFMAIHGMSDGLTPYHGGSRHGAKILPVPEVFQSYERRNLCAGGVSRQRIAPNATRVSARGCTKGVEVIQMHGGNHSWWSSPSSADEMWAFLSRHAK